MRRLGFLLSAIIGALTLVIGLGQGCHQGAKFSSTEPAGTLARTDSGNGGVYDGKPEGNYYHFLPDFKCEGVDFPQEILSLTQTSATLSRSTTHSCASASANIPLDLIDHSPYQSGVIGYQASIFASKESLPVRTPDRLVEAWCRDTAGPFGFETIGFYDRALRTAQQEVYFTNAQGQTERLPPFDVSRLIENRRIHYQRDQFDLVIRRQEPGGKSGLYRGHLSLVVEGQRHEREMECRLGAE